LTLLVFPTEALIRTLRMFESGGFTVRARDADVIKVNATAHEFIVDLQNPEVVRDLSAPFRSLGAPSVGGDEKERELSLLEKLKAIKNFAEKLREEHVTITIRRQGDPLLTIGEKANPGLSRLVFGRSIQANTLKILSLLRTLQ